MPILPRSPLFYASVGLAILAFAAPGRAHAEAVDPASADPISAPDTDGRTSRPPIVDDPLDPTSPPVVTSPSPPPPPSERASRWLRSRVAGAVGVRFGNFTINGDSSGAVIPFHLDLGLRRDRWLVYGSYDVFGVTARVPAAVPGDVTPRAGTTGDLGDGSGLAHRLGATARYVFGRYAESDGGFEVWAEGGLGVQHLRWDAGGTWTRPDLQLGIGGTILGLGDHRHGGFSIGLRVLVAPRNDTANAPPVCGGPCDTATPPSALDRSFLFDLSVPFGT